MTCVCESDEEEEEEEESDECVHPLRRAAAALPPGRLALPRRLVAAGATGWTAVLRYYGTACRVSLRESVIDCGARPSGPQLTAPAPSGPQRSVRTAVAACYGPGRARDC